MVVENCFTGADLSARSTWESYWDFPPSVNSTEGLVKFYDTGIQQVEGLFKKGGLEESYDYQQNLTALASINATYLSDKWHDEADTILLDLWTGVANAIFEHFGIETPEPQEQEEGGDVVAKLFEDFKIGNADVDAIDALFGKAHAGIENEHLVAIAHQRAVHPELADAAEGNNFKDVSHY